MDLAALGGTAMMAILVGWAAMGSGSLSILVDSRALLLTVGGAVALTMVQYPLRATQQALRITLRSLRWRPEPLDPLVDLFVQFAERTRRNGLLALEEDAASALDPVLRKGLTLAVDGTSAEAVRHMLALDLLAMQRRQSQAAALLQSLARNAQACGMFGTLLGFVQILGSGVMGAAAAGPLVATLYGTALAGLVAQPLAGRIRHMQTEQHWTYQLIVEGIAALVDGDNPTTVSLKLRTLGEEDSPRAGAPVTDGMGEHPDGVKRYA